MVVTEEGEIIGYGGFMLVESDAHITTLGVAVERAVGRGARHLTLEVRATNTDAQLLYERFGFSPVGKRKGYYRGEDAIVMWALDVDAEEYSVRLDEIRTYVKAGSA